nr:glutaredoxin domain-containing protein [Natranaerobius trueperi]
MKEYLSQKEIDYVEHDVSQDEKARDRMVEETGQMVVPIIKVGEEYVVGFEKDALEKLL